MLTIAEPTTDTVAGHRASTPAIEVIGVTQRTQDRTTLHDVSFSVTPGEVVALVGGSGAGKTTLLETMLGIRPPASGEVRIAGAPARADLGYVPQDDIIHRDLALARTPTVRGLRRHRGDRGLPARPSPHVSRDVRAAYTAAPTRHVRGERDRWQISRRARVATTIPSRSTPTPRPPPAS